MVLTACGGGSTDSSSASGAAGEPCTVKVGVATGQTGGLAYVDVPNLEGFDIWKEEINAAGGIDVDQHRALRGLPAVFKDGRGHPSSVDRLVADEVIRHGGAAVESGQEHQDRGDGRCDSNRRSRGHPTTVDQPPSNGVAGGGDDPRERLETRVAGR